MCFAYPRTQRTSRTPPGPNPESNPTDQRNTSKKISASWVIQAPRLSCHNGDQVNMRDIEMSDASDITRFPTSNTSKKRSLITAEKNSQTARITLTVDGDDFIDLTRSVLDKYESQESSNAHNISLSWVSGRSPPQGPQVNLRQKCPLCKKQLGGSGIFRSTIVRFRLVRSLRSKF